MCCTSVDTISADGAYIWHSFILYSSLLLYRFTFLQLEYGVVGFPVHVIPNGRIADEINAKGGDVSGKELALFTTKSQEELTDILSSVFLGEKRRQIIRTLWIRQARQSDTVAQLGSNPLLLSLQARELRRA